MARVETRSYQKPQEASFLRKKKRETVGSEAFNLEYDAPPTRDELRADVVSYLGEYRLQVQKYAYDYVFGRDKDRRGPITLRDGNRGEAMQFKTKRVIEERTRKWEPVSREKAEDRGITLINNELRTAQTGDTLVWASPPGPKEQGYGDYGFIYAGKVTKLANGESHLAMTAIRVENPTIEQFNKALTGLTGEKVSNKKAEDFLETPTLVKKDIKGQEVDVVLQGAFDFKADPKEREKTAAIVKQMEPLIDQFLDVMEGGSTAKKLKAFYTLENYALQLKEEYGKGEKVVYQKNVHLDDLTDRYGGRPPMAKGSCGSTGNSLMSAGRAEMSRILGGSSKEWFTCPKCHYKADGPVGNRCPGCGLTKEAYAAESGVSCD